MLDHGAWKEADPAPQTAGAAEIGSDLRDHGDGVLTLRSASGDPVAIDGLSLVFDPEWYRDRYPDSAGQDPVEHYLRAGWLSGCDPNPLFSTRDYLSANPDVAAAALNPFVHYVLYGACQGRKPNADP